MVSDKINHLMKEKIVEDAKFYKILEELNKEHSGDIDEDFIVVKGIHFCLNEFIDGDKLTQTLTSNEVEFEREGRKEISYDRWVDTYWYDWE